MQIKTVTTQGVEDIYSDVEHINISPRDDTWERPVITIHRGPPLKPVTVRVPEDAVDVWQMDNAGDTIGHWPRRPGFSRRARAEAELTKGKTA